MAGPQAVPPSGLRGLRRMGKITGFLEFERNDRDYEPVAERIRHWREFVLPLPEAETRQQAARCMNCGIPFCHTGCPVNNQIPDWNDLVYSGAWREASFNLHSTNNFPEFTGRVCPAPCEASCTLNIRDNPVTLKTIECAIVDRAFEQGWVVPEPPSRWWGRVQPASPARSSSRVPATMSTFMRSSPSRADCCVTACRTSRWRST